MVIRHILAVWAAFHFGSSGMASEVKLGPEMPFAEVVTRPASVSIYLGPMVAASNGRDFLVGWNAADAYSEFVMKRVDGNGGAPGLPQRTGYHYGPQPIVRRGNGYLLVSTNLEAVRLDENGAPISAPTKLSKSGGLRALIPNGSTHLLVYFENGESRGMILDSEGTPLRKLDFDFHDFVGGGVHNGHFVFVTQVIRKWTLHRIADDGRVFDVPLLHPATLVNASFAAFGSQGILFTFNSGRTYTVVGYDGSIIQPPTDMPLSTRYSDLIRAVWSGNEFLLIYRKGDVVPSKGYRVVYTATEALRMAPDGSLLDGIPFVLANRDISDIELAFSDTEMLLILVEADEWRKTRAVMRIVRDVHALAAADDPDIPLEVPSEQIRSSFALGPRGLFGVWMDSIAYEVRASINGRPIVVDRAALGEAVGWPGVATGANVFLVAWWHLHGGNPTELLGRRYDFDGVPIDPAPVVLARSSYAASSWPVRYQPDIGFGGSSFLIVWKDGDHRLVTARIGETGAASDIRPIPLPPLIPAPFYRGLTAEAGRPIWTGSEFVLPYCFEPFAAPTFLLTRINDLNDDLAAATHTMFDDWGIASFRVGAVVAQGTITYAWAAATGGIAVAQTALDGMTILQSPRPSTDSTTREPVPAVSGGLYNEIVWNGSEYVVIWFGYDGKKGLIKAIRFDDRLKRIDREAFTVNDASASSDTASPPSLIATSGGAIIAYTGEENGLPRIFTRTLDGLGSDPRRRAVR